MCDTLKRLHWPMSFYDEHNVRAPFLSLLRSFAALFGLHEASQTHRTQCANRYNVCTSFSATFFHFFFFFFNAFVIWLIARWLTLFACIGAMAKLGNFTRDETAAIEHAARHPPKSASGLPRTDVRFWEAIKASPEGDELRFRTAASLLSRYLTHCAKQMPKHADEDADDGDYSSSSNTSNEE